MRLKGYDWHSPGGVGRSERIPVYGKNAFLGPTAGRDEASRTVIPLKGKVSEKQSLQGCLDSMCGAGLWNMLAFGKRKLRRSEGAAPFLSRLPRNDTSRGSLLALLHFFFSWICRFYFAAFCRWLMCTLASSYVPLNFFPAWQLIIFMWDLSGT